MLAAPGNKEVKSLNDFIGLIGTAFQENWIDPDAPHLHRDPGNTT